MAKGNLGSPCVTVRSASTLDKHTSPVAGTGQQISLIQCWKWEGRTNPTMLLILAASTVFWGYEQPKCWGCSQDLAAAESAPQPSPTHLLPLATFIAF